MDANIADLDSKHWVLTRCGKIVLVKNHSSRDFSWSQANLDIPIIKERSRLFKLTEDKFTLNHPSIDAVEDAIAQQMLYYYWTKPNKITYSILNLAENESKMIFLKSSELDLLIGDENWTTIANEHPAHISFSKRLDGFKKTSDIIKDKLYFLGEDNGWLVLFRMQANLYHHSIKVCGMIFHSDPMLQLNSQNSWERHGNKKLHLAFSKKGGSSKMQDSIWTNVGWSNSNHCMLSQLRISEKLVNDNRIKSTGA
ncbi:MAG: hypothetical protein HWE27_08845 [Gammaproteobacteria bacterium]|nr:hypothetical protein [Gammaproteobacteria bacterium]